jgi:hypothetical protein
LAQECPLPPLPDNLDADVEGQERERYVAARQAEGREPARESEPVQETEGEGGHPRVADREAGFSPPFPDDLLTEEKDRERDRRIEGRRRNIGVPPETVDAERLRMPFTAQTWRQSWAKKLCSGFAAWA